MPRTSLQEAPPGDPTSRLTPREREVLELMAQGHTNAGIAAQLWLTNRTVESHVANILGKLGLRESTEHRRVRAVLIWLGLHRTDGRHEAEQPSRPPTSPVVASPQETAWRP
jgi:DNA-binding NarL/FixJ family response regulator